MSQSTQRKKTGETQNGLIENGLPERIPVEEDLEFPSNWTVEPVEKTRSGSRFYRVTGVFEKRFGTAEKVVMVCQLSDEEGWKAVTGSQPRRPGKPLETGGLADVVQVAVEWAEEVNREYLAIEGVSLPSE